VGEAVGKKVGDVEGAAVVGLFVGCGVGGTYTYKVPPEYVFNVPGSRGFVLPSHVLHGFASLDL
jgi:hypothetical protein